VINLWPEGVPGAKAIGAERIADGRIGNVSEPILIVYKPAVDRPTGTAVIICPGGGPTGVRPWFGLWSGLRSERIDIIIITLRLGSDDAAAADAGLCRAQFRLLGAVGADRVEGAAGTQPRHRQDRADVGAEGVLERLRRLQCVVG
jgi:hypothetical protein